MTMKKRHLMFYFLTFYSFPFTLSFVVVWLSSLRLYSNLSCQCLQWLVNCEMQCIFLSLSSKTSVLYLTALLIEILTLAPPQLLVALHLWGPNVDSLTAPSEQIILCRTVTFCWFVGAALASLFFSLHTLSLSSTLITPKFLLRARWSASVVS